MLEGCLVARCWKTIDWIWDWNFFLCGNCIKIYKWNLISRFMTDKQIKRWSCCHSKQVPVYITEITPKNLRGGFTTVHQVSYCTFGYYIINGYYIFFVNFTLPYWISKQRPLNALKRTKIRTTILFKATKLLSKCW